MAPLSIGNEIKLDSGEKVAAAVIVFNRKAAYTCVEIHQNTNLDEVSTTCDSGSAFKIAGDTAC